MRVECAAQHLVREQRPDIVAGMEERARSTGGRISVHSTRGRGATVVAELPLD